MKQNVVLIATALLFGLLALSSCESTGETKKPTLSVTAPFTQKFEGKLDIAAFNQSAARAAATNANATTFLRADDERVMFDKVMSWDLTKVAKDNGFASFNFTKLDVNKITLRVIEPKDLNLAFFETVRIYAGADYKLIAEGKMTDMSTAELSVKDPNLLPFLKVDQMPIKVTTTQYAPIEIDPGVAQYLTFELEFYVTGRISQK